MPMTHVLVLGCWGEKELDNYSKLLQQTVDIGNMFMSIFDFKKSRYFQFKE